MSCYKVIIDANLNYYVDPCDYTESIMGLDTSIPSEDRDFLTWISVLPDGDVINGSSKFLERYMSMTEDDGVTLLHKVCACGDLEQLTLLCDTSNIETGDKYNYRPIHVACIFGHLVVLEYLHEHGCDMNTPGNFGTRPLHLAAKHGRLDVVKYLCSHQCDLDVPLKHCWTPIHLACRFGHLEIVKHLCEQGCDKEVLTNREEQPLHIACMYGHLEIMKFLCEQKCDIEASNEDKETPLLLACTKGHLEIVKFLLEQNCDIEAPGLDDCRPIHYACIYGHLDIVMFLCEQNCDLEAPDCDNERPIHYASRHGHLDIVMFLVARNCDIEAPTYKNNRPIHYASQHGHLDIVRFLCEQNCDSEATNSDKRRPIHLADQYNHINIVKYLCERKTNTKVDISVLICENRKQQLVQKIRDIKVECDERCDHSSCLKGILSNRDKIGMGAFGKVYKVTDPQLNYTYCIKSISLDTKPKFSKPKHIEFNIKKYLKLMHHERIMQYFAMKTKPEKMFIFMEYVEGISLDKRINNKPLPHNKVIQYSKEILEGLKFLHQNKIMHRDIKPPNIMLNAEEHVKLCDFGLSCYLESIGQKSEIQPADSSIKMTWCGTPNYMAPECIIGQTYSYPVDIWALGASVVEMLTGKPPFHGMEECSVIFKIGTVQKIDFVPAEPMSEDMKSFLGQMLCPCPSERATAQTLLEFISHAFSI